MLRGKDRIKSLYKESQLAGSYPARVKRSFSYVLVHRTEASFLEQFTRQRSLSKAMDLACGTGRLLPFLHAFKIVAVDRSKEMVR